MHRVNSGIGSKVTEAECKVYNCSFLSEVASCRKLISLKTLLLRPENDIPRHWTEL